MLHQLAVSGCAVILLSASGCGSGDEPQPESPEAEATPRVDAADIDRALENGALLLDVRTAAELAAHGTIEGFVHIPIDELEGRLDELPRGVPILTA